MKFHFKRTGPFRGEAWIEDGKYIVCQSKLVLVPNDGDGIARILIDGIDTPAEFRRKGYASFLVKTILENYPDSAPTTIDDNPRARAFWKKLGLEPALGWEDDDV